MLRGGAARVNRPGALGGDAPRGVTGTTEPFIKRSRRHLAFLALLIGLCHAVLVVVGALVSGASGAETVGRLGTPLAQLDALGVEQLTRRFEPALAPGLHAALGPQPPIFLVLGLFLLCAGLLGRWRSVPRTLLATLLAVLLALELWGVGTLLFERAAPLTLDPALPVPEDWRAPWQAGGSYVSRHALLAATLAVSALIAWAPLGLPALVLALCGALTAVYFGAAHVTDALFGLLLGVGAAVAGRLGVSVVWSGSLK